MIKLTFLLLCLANLSLAQDVASINSIYQVKLILNQSVLEADTRFQEMASQPGITKEDCTRLVKCSALAALKDNWLSHGSFWTQVSEDCILGRLSLAAVDDLQYMFPEGNFITCDVLLVKEELDTSERIKLAKEKQSEPFKCFIGLSFIEARELLRQQYVQSGEDKYMARCRVKSIDSELLEIDFSSSGYYLLFEIEGGQVTHVESLERK